MRANVAVELSETDRRRIRAALGRGGMATRREFRIFADRAIRDAIAATPEPRPTRRAKAPAPATPIALESDDARCSTCERPKVEHGRMGRTCPPRPGKLKGTRFTP